MGLGTASRRREQIRELGERLLLRGSRRIIGYVARRGYRRLACGPSAACLGVLLSDRRDRMASKLKIKVNGLVHNVTASLDTPLLYVLHNELHLHGPRFGCGLAQCGACSVLLDGKEIRSCVTLVAGVSGQEMTSIEGVRVRYDEYLRAT